MGQKKIFKFEAYVPVKYFIEIEETDGERALKKAYDYLDDIKRGIIENPSRSELPVDMDLIRADEVEEDEYEQEDNT
jgi:hypothetical protein